MLGAYLKKYRLEHCYSQQKMAEKLGTSQSYYSMLENGVKKPGLKIKNNIAELLEVEPSFISKLL